jgi:hypothetical protein
MRDAVFARDPEPASACSHGLAGVDRGAHPCASPSGWRQRATSNDQSSTPRSARDCCVTGRSSRIAFKDRRNFRTSETVALILGIVNFSGSAATEPFSSASQLDSVLEYVNKQQEHHRRCTFQDEYRELLRKHGVDFDERTFGLGPWMNRAFSACVKRGIKFLADAPG